MNVEYVYLDYVQAMLDKIDESIKHEDEWFSEQFKRTQDSSNCAAGLNMELIVEKYERRVAPLIEAKNRVVNNALPMQIIITE